MSEPLTSARVAQLLPFMHQGVSIGGEFGHAILSELHALLKEREAAPLLKVHAPHEVPPWPPTRREGVLLIDSDTSVPVLAYVAKWGWHVVVSHEDDDLAADLSRHFWTDPTGFFKPEDLRNSLRCWVSLPSEPGGV